MAVLRVPLSVMGALLFVVFVVSALGQSSTWTAKPDVVAAAAKQQPGFNYEESKVGAYRLPDVLAGGPKAVSTAAAWPTRRAEMLAAFRDTVYGRSPGRPESSRFVSIERNPRAMNGAATLERIAITSGVAGRSHQFELTLFVPNQPTGRVPVLLLLNNRPAANTDPTRTERSGFWPAEDLVARGYGIAAIQVAQLAPDDKDRFREGVIALFEGVATGPRASQAWGALAAWAWGASRALDYLVTAPRVDSARIGVVGHSRGGKAALWAGAQDERFGLVVSNESGEGGAALSRRAFGETVARINSSFPHWFTDTYKTFDGREAELPVDQHMLLALVAPRPLYVASADEDLWSDPRGEFLSIAAASPAYALFGDPILGEDRMPPLDTPVVVGRRAYHVRTGGHNLTPYDWARFADFADRVWRK